MTTKLVMFQTLLDRKVWVTAILTASMCLVVDEVVFKQSKVLQIIQQSSPHRDDETPFFQPSTTIDHNHVSSRVASSSTRIIEVDQCNNDTLAIIDKINTPGFRSGASKCPKQSWLDQFWMYKQYKRLEGSNGGKDSSSLSSFLGFSIGCNKAFDAVNMLRMGSFNSQVRKSDWLMTLTANTDMGSTKDFFGACGSAHGKQFDPIISSETNVDNAEWHCVEPMANNYDVVSKSSKDLGYEKYGFKVHRAAVSSKVGHIYFPDVKKFGTEHLGISDCDPVTGKTVGTDKFLREQNISQCEKVDMTTLDWLVDHAVSPTLQNAPIDILSIDTEGHDMEALLGAKKLTLQRTLYLEFEYHKVGVWPDRTLKPAIDMLSSEEYGFNCYWLFNNDKLLRITKCWLDQYNKPMWSNIACVHKSKNPILAETMEKIHQDYVQENMQR